LPFESPELDSALMSGRRPPRQEDSALATRLFVVEEDVRELKTQISTGFASLHTKFEERSKIQWPAWTLFFAALLAIGGFAYWPIRENQTMFREELREARRESTQELQRALQEGLDRDRHLLNMLIKVQVDLGRIEGIRGRD